MSHAPPEFASRPRRPAQLSTPSCSPAPAAEPRVVAAVAVVPPASAPAASPRSSARDPLVAVPPAAAVRATTAANSATRPALVPGVTAPASTATCGARPALAVVRGAYARRSAPALAAPALPLRALLVAPGECARHPGALARELAPGLCELVGNALPDGRVEIPGTRELAGLGRAGLFHRARLGTCSERLQFSLAAPSEGVHAYMLGGPGQVDTAAAVLELESLLGQPPGPVGVVVAFPARGTALFVAPGARRLRRSLVAWGLRQFWCAEPEAAPLRLGDTLRFMAGWARDAHRTLPGPISPLLYWHHHGKLSALGDLGLSHLPRELARLVVASA